MELSLAGGARATFHQGYLSRLIYGDRGQTAVDPFKLEMMSDVLGVDFHWLSTGREPAEVAAEPSAREHAATFARSFGTREDAIDHVLAMPDDPSRDSKYWFDMMAAESEARKRAMVPERPKTFQRDVRRKHAEKKRRAEKQAPPPTVPAAPKSTRKAAG